MTTDPDSSTSTAGRQVTLTPVAPGVWLIIGGGVLAALGPLFGLLIGSMLSSTTSTGDLSPIYLFFFAGMALGGLGVATALAGARRVIRDRRDSPPG